MTKEEVEKTRKILERYDPELVSLALQDLDLSASAVEKAKKGIAAAYDSIAAESTREKTRVMARAVTEAQIDMIKTEIESIKKALGKTDRAVITEAASALGLDMSHYLIHCPPGEIFCVPGLIGCTYAHLVCPTGPIDCVYGGIGCVYSMIYTPQPNVGRCLEYIPSCGLCIRIMNVLGRHPAGSVIVEGRLAGGIIIEGRPSRNIVVDVLEGFQAYLCEEQVHCIGKQITVMSRCSGSLFALDVGGRIDPADALRKIAETSPIMSKRVEKMLAEMKSAGEL